MLVCALSLAALLNGCGSDSKESAGSPADVAKVDEATCAQCHGSSYDSTSGQPIYSGYVQSKHFKNSIGEVIGCQDCHGGGSQHNGVGPIPYPNPDAAGKCFGCHKPAFLGLYEPTGKATAIEAAHFYNITGAGTHPAMYVTTNYQKACTVCHEPHNPIQGLGKDERKAWAQSGHGDTTAAAWATEDFKTASGGACARCHSTTGNLNYAKTGVDSVFSQPGDNGREVLTCQACHMNDSFSVRPAAQFTAKYNSGKNPKTFPSVGNSNLCIACHSARESGDTVAAVADFSNSSFVNSHYMGAAATMYMSNAFINFTTQTAPAATNNEGSPFASTKPYAKNNLPDNLSVPGYGISGGTTSSHRRIGTPLIAGSETYLPAGGIAITTNGPCVTCHLQADNPIPGDTAQNMNIPVPAVRTAHGHSLQIDNDTANQLCLPCHADAPHLDGGTGTGAAIYTTVNSLATLQSAQLEPQSAAFQNGLNLLKQILSVKYMIKYDPTAYPYFYDMQKDPTGKTAMKDWTRKNVAGVSDAAVAAFASATLTPIPAGGFSQKQAMRVMGACFNLNLLIREPGSYVHARTFTQRLVYDALDFLDNNQMDFTALTSARKLDPVNFKGTNVNVFASDGTLATEAMAWLAGTHYTDTSSGNTLKPLKLHP
jgi:nitrate reductase cytochrome c-type subunit